jgi:DNA replication protein DnaC
LLMDVHQDLERQLRRLKMPGLWHALDMRLAEAREGKLGHLEFLSLLVQDELCSREDSMFSKRLKAAGFGVDKTFADFDYRFNDKALPPAAVRDLATCHFVEQRQNAVIGGPPGIGKTHVVKALGHEACRRGYHVLFRSTHRLLAEVLSDSAEHADRTLRRAIAVDLLILDDFAFRKLDQKEAEMLYVLAEERVGKASTVLTSNRPPEDWYAIFPDPVVGGAVLDRLVSSAIKLISTSGKSYRREVMGNTVRPSAKAAAKAEP